MKYDLDQRRIAVLATDGYEKSELEDPVKALEESNAQYDIVSLEATPETIRGWSGGDWKGTTSVDRTVEEAEATEYDGLLIPGGVMNPDRLRMDEPAVRFVRDFFRSGKPVAAICHGPWMLIEADAVDGRRVTSWRSIRTDLENADAEWVDEEVVVDEGLVTSRSPADLPAFVDKMLEEFAEGVHAEQTL